MQLKRVCKEAIVRSLFASISGRARVIAVRSRSGRGLLPRQLRSINGMVSAQKKLDVLTADTQSLPIDSIYTYTWLQNANPNFDLAPL